MSGKRPKETNIEGQAFVVSRSNPNAVTANVPQASREDVREMAFGYMRDLTEYADTAYWLAALRWFLQLEMMGPENDDHWRLEYERYKNIVASYTHQMVRDPDAVGLSVDNVLLIRSAFWNPTGADSMRACDYLYSAYNQAMNKSGDVALADSRKRKGSVGESQLSETEIMNIVRAVPDGAKAIVRKLSELKDAECVGYSYFDKTAPNTVAKHLPWLIEQGLAAEKENQKRNNIMRGPNALAVACRLPAD